MSLINNRELPTEPLISDTYGLSSYERQKAYLYSIRNTPFRTRIAAAYPMSIELIKAQLLFFQRPEVKEYLKYLETDRHWLSVRD